MFLKHLEECGNVTEAARRTGIPRQTFVNLRQNNSVFRSLYDEAVARATAALEVEARRRATQGVTKMVTSMGRVVRYKGKPLVEHIYSDRLLMFLMQAHDPRFKQRVDVTSGDKPIPKVNVVMEGANVHAPKPAVVPKKS